MSLFATVIGHADSVHAMDSQRPERNLCGQQYDAVVGSWDEEFITKRCLKCVRLAGPGPGKKKVLLRD